MTTDDYVTPKIRQWTGPPSVKEEPEPKSKRGGKKGERKNSSKEIDQIIERILDGQDTFTPQELQAEMGGNMTPNNVLRLRVSRGLISKLGTGLYTRGPGVATGESYRKKAKVKAKSVAASTSPAAGDLLETIGFIDSKVILLRDVTTQQCYLTKVMEVKS